MPERWPVGFFGLFLVLAAKFADACNYGCNTIVTVISTEVFSAVHALLIAPALSVLETLPCNGAVATTTGQEIVKGPLTEATACL